ncbi:MAG: hypothetical protein KDK72_00425 [Chlamydiia bacterium]|nr:hypothetical protein [Chlamydiia bacterium]
MQDDTNEGSFRRVYNAASSAMLSLHHATLGTTFDAVIGNTDILEKKIAQFQRELIEITGSDEPARFVDRLVTYLLGQFNGSERTSILFGLATLQTILEVKYKYVSCFLQAIFLRGTTEVVKHLERRGSKAEIQEHILLFFLNFFREEFSSDALRLEYEQMLKRGKREDLVQLFSPIVFKLLDQLIPEACSEDQFVQEWADRTAYGASYVYKSLLRKLRDSFLPDMMISLYRFLMRPSYRLQDYSVHLDLPGARALEALLQSLQPVVVEFLAKKEESLTAVPIIADFVRRNLKIQEEDVLFLWVQSRVQNVLESDDEGLKFLCDALGDKLCDALKRGCYEIILSEDPEAKQNPLITLLNYFAPLFREFIMIEENSDCENLLEDLSCRILNKLSLDRWAPTIHHLGIQLLPGLLLQFHRALTKPLGNRECLTKEIADNFYDQDDILQYVDTASIPKNYLMLLRRMTDIHTVDPTAAEVLRDLTYSTEVATEVGRGGDIVAEDIVRALQRFWASGEGEHSIADRVYRWLEIPSTPGEKEALNQLFYAIGTRPSDDLSALYMHAKKQIAVVIIKGLIDFSMSTPAVFQKTNQGHPLYWLPANACSRVLSVLFKNTRDLQRRVQLAERDNNPNTAVCAVFQPLADELLQSAFPSLEQVLPLPAFFQTVVARSLRSYIIPRILYDQYKDLTQWHRLSDEYSRRLNHCFKTTHPVEANKVVAKFVEGFLPYYFTKSCDYLGGLLARISVTYFKNVSQSPERQQTIGYLESQQEKIARVLRDNIERLAGPETRPEFLQTWSVAAEYVESMILVIFTQAFENISSIDTVDLRNKIADKVAVRIIEHIGELNRIKNKLRTGDLSKVSYDKLLQEYDRTILHPAVSTDSKMTQEQQEDHRIDRFFAPTTKKIMELGDVNSPEKFPFPAALKEVIWEVVTEQMIPTIMMGGSTVLGSPRIVDITVACLLENIDNAAFSADDESNSYAFDEIIGNCFKEIIDFLPSSLYTLPFKAKKLRDLAADKIGRTLRSHLSYVNITQIVDKIIVAWLPLFHEGQWKGLRSEELFVPMKVIQGTSGVPIREPMPVASFYFPNTQEGRDNALRKEKEETKKNKKYLEQLMAEKAVDKSEEEIRAVLERAWKRLQGFLDRKINDWFGEKGAAFKQKIDSIFRVIFFDMIGAFLRILFIPIYKLSRSILEVSFATQSPKNIDQLHMRIHETLIYHIVDDVLDLLLEMKLEKYRTV